MNFLRRYWNHVFDLPKVRGGSWQMIPLEVRDTQHPDYDCWADFIEFSRGVELGPHATWIAWLAFKANWKYIKQ